MSVAEILCVLDPGGGPPASKVMNLKVSDRLTEWFIKLYFAAKKVFKKREEIKSLLDQSPFWERKICLH